MVIVMAQKTFLLYLKTLNWREFNICFFCDWVNVGFCINWN